MIVVVIIIVVVIVIVIICNESMYILFCLLLSSLALPCLGVSVRKTFMRKERKKRKHKLIHPDKQTARQQDKSRQDKSSQDEIYKQTNKQINK